MQLLSTPIEDRRGRFEADVKLSPCTINHIGTENWIVVIQNQSFLFFFFFFSNLGNLWKNLKKWLHSVLMNIYPIIIYSILFPPKPEHWQDYCDQQEKNFNNFTGIKKKKKSPVKHVFQSSPWNIEIVSAGIQFLASTFTRIYDTTNRAKRSRNSWRCSHPCHRNPSTKEGINWSPTLIQE